MRIVIKEEGKLRLFLMFPTRCVFSPLVVRLAYRFTKPGEISISKEQMTALFREINRFRKTHRGFTLVEVRSSNKDLVKITL